MAEKFLRTVRVKLEANKPTLVPTMGALMILQSLSAGDSIEVTWRDDQGNDAGTVEEVAPGRKYIPGGIYNGFIALSTGDCEAVFIVGPANADANLAINTIANVSNDPIETLPAPAAALTEPAPVVVDDTATQLLAADAARRSVRIYNEGPDTVALIPAAGTFDTSPILILMGQTWRESDAAQLALYGICDTGGGATVRIQEVS